MQRFRQLEDIDKIRRTEGETDVQTSNKRQTGIRKQTMIFLLTDRISVTRDCVQSEPVGPPNPLTNWKQLHSSSPTPLDPTPNDAELRNKHDQVSIQHAKYIIKGSPQHTLFSLHIDVLPQKMLFNIWANRSVPFSKHGSSHLGFRNRSRSFFFPWPHKCLHADWTSLSARDLCSRTGYCSQWCKVNLRKLFSNFIKGYNTDFVINYRQRYVLLTLPISAARYPPQTRLFHNTNSNKSTNEKNRTVSHLYRSFRTVLRFGAKG